MNSFSLAFSVVCPLFLMMALGYFLRHIGLFTEDLLRQLNRICFQVFLPVLLFINVYNSDFSAVFKPKLVVFALSSLVVLFVLLMLLVPLLEKKNPRRGVLVQGIFRSNYILFGLPVAASLFGAENTGITAILIVFVVPVFNLLSVVALEVFQKGRINPGRIFMGVIKNPLILGALVASFFILTGFRLPHVLEVTVSDISKIATPLALIILGASFSFSRVHINWKALLGAVSFRLVFVPAVFLSLAVLIGYRGLELGALLAMFASPTAVSSFTMAQQMNGDDELAGQIVVVSSLCSILTVFMWISVLAHAGLLI